MKIFLSRALGAVFGVIMAIVVVIMSMSLVNNTLALWLLAFAFIAAIFVYLRYFAFIIDKLTKHKFFIIIGSISIVAFFIQLTVGIQLMIYPLTDLEVVLNDAANFIHYGDLLDGRGGYYIPCPNNIGLCLTLTAFYKVMSFFGIYIGGQTATIAGIVFNAVLMNLSIVLMLYFSKLIFNRQSVTLLTLLFSVFFAPYYLWTVHFYSDTLSMFIPLLVCFVYHKSSTCKNMGLKYLLLILTAFIIFVGYWLKGSVLVMLVAICIYIFLTHNFKQTLCKCAILCVVTVGLISAWDAYFYNNNWIDIEPESGAGLPITLQFVYGSYGDGNYKDEIVQEVIKYDTFAAREEYLKSELIKRYSSYTPVTYVQFLFSKAAITWGDGKYDAQKYIVEAVNSNTPIHSIVYPNRALYAPFTYYTSIYHLAILLLMVFSLFYKSFKGKIDLITLMQISVFGIFVFLSFWETKPKYLINFLPMVLLLAVSGAIYMQQLTIPGKITGIFKKNKK